MGGSHVDESSLLPFGIAKDAPVGLVGRAVLPAATFVDGPGSGALIGSELFGAAGTGIFVFGRRQGRVVLGTL